MRTARELPRFGVRAPRIAVAGLNPHAGEHGLFGREDEDVSRPAIASCRARGLDVAGPFPGDTVFLRASRGEFDVVIACYHDQGLIPVKLLAFGRAVNVTLGLPIVRTSATSVRKLLPRWEVVVISVRVTWASWRSTPIARATRAIDALTR